MLFRSFAGALLGAEAVGVLVDPQLKQRGEHLAAQVAAVRQLLLVGPDVIQELLQLLEGLGARLYHALVDLDHTNPYVSLTHTHTCTFDKKHADK